MRPRAIYLPLTDDEKRSLEGLARERKTTQRQLLRDVLTNAVRELEEKKKAAMMTAPR